MTAMRPLEEMSVGCTLCGRRMADQEQFDADVLPNTGNAVEDFWMLIRCKVCVAKTWVDDGGNA